MPKLLCATDALACWIFGELAEGRDPLGRLVELQDDSSFVKFITTERNEGRLRRDDTTFLLIESDNAVPTDR